MSDVLIVFEDTNTKAVLRNCLYVPEFDINLISASCLIKRGFKLIMESTCTIQSLSNALISSSVCNEGLYKFLIISNIQYSLNTKSSIDQEDKTVLWHQRMGHIGLKALKELGILSRGAKDFTCEECI